MTPEEELDLEEAVDTVMDYVDNNTYASAVVPPEHTLDFYEAIIERCRTRMDAIRAENGL